MLVNSIDNTINIYDDKTISGVNNIIRNGENKDLVNNSTVSTNINDNNICALDSEENTPGEESIRTKHNLKLVDSDPPLNLRTEIANCTENEAIPTTDTDTPVLRLRGGIGEEVNEGQNEEEIVGERFILTTLEKEE
jgi:hypothetical protein